MTTPIAIVGMAGRFPGASNLAELWENLCKGVDSIRHFSDEELAATEHAFDEVRGDPGFVKARGILDGVEDFDAAFFGFRPREAAALDPQQRVWFECAWEALEDAGVAPGKLAANIGVYAGGGYLDTYLLHNLCIDRDFIERLVRLRSVDAFQNIISNDKDFLPTRTSHLFDLTGPSVNVQTACSTSLVAVVQACQSLILGESDICLAGGISIQLPQVRGYLAQEGGMDSSDGRVRPFDARASGTVFGNGVGVVVLKRLADAQADGDRVLAVLRGYSVNNDGARKASYIAPSSEGQSSVIRKAIENAGIDASTISYVEAHGTGTSVGDPIEVDGLSRVFRESTDKVQFCGIGSIKSNVGHLDSAAGVAGLIKTVLALKAGELPPTVHFETPNPAIDFESSPFYVVTERRPWETQGIPRRAGVSSFGVGGTNAHVIAEEAPEVSPSKSTQNKPWQLLAFSARSPAALDAKSQDLASFLDKSTESLTNISYSLLTGREDMKDRRFAVCSDLADSAEVFRSASPPRVVTGKSAKQAEQLVFMFPGQGAQHLDMGRELYDTEPLFKSYVDRCADLLIPHLGLDLRELLFASEKRNPDEQSEELKQTRIAQPALFTIEYSLAKLWMSWGVVPKAMVGHSIGDYVAACLADVFDLEGALAVVAERGRLMQAQPSGSMLAVLAGEDDVLALTAETPSEDPVVLAASNSPATSVVSGTDAAIERFAELCAGRGVEVRPLHTSHAFHSPMMDPMLEPFTARIAEAKPRKPAIPFVSSRTGTWIQDEEAQSPTFWARQVREPVRFRDAIQTLQEQAATLYLEVGPGTTLSSFVRQSCGRGEAQAVSSLGGPRDSASARAKLLAAVGGLWMAGQGPDWSLFFSDHDCRRVALPTYPFQRKRFWIEPPSTIAQQDSPSIEPAPKTMPSDAPPPAAPSRRPIIRKELLELLIDLSGNDFGPDEQEMTFIEMGFDSLFLTQFATALQSGFGMKVRFRRMLEDLCTVDALTDFLDAELPADKFAPPPAPAPAPAPAPSASMPQPAASPQMPLSNVIAADASAMERVVNQQLQLMQQQLQMLSGLPATQVGGQEAQPLTPQAIVPPAVDVPAVDVPAVDAKKPKAFGAQARIETEADEFSAAQRRCYEDFAKGYLAKTAASKDFTQKNRKLMADPRAVTGFRPVWKELVYPIVVDKSKGAKLWDLDGNEYVDLTCGFGSNFLGNQPDFITKALHDQIEKGYEVGPQHPLTSEVSELIQELTGSERVAFCNTGSEAVMGAMRQARTLTGRSLVAIFTNSYHGIFDEVIVRGTRTLRSIAAAPGILASAVENVLVLDYDSPKSLEILRERGNELAAIMAEPVQSRNPKLQPREFLHELRRIADDCGAALIFDEVITGFRICPGGAQEYFGVRADLATYGKIIGGGLPFAAIAGKAAWMDALDGGDWQYGDDSYPEVGVTYFAGTFVRHPLALAAAKASLEHLKAEGPELQKRLNQRTTAFVAELNEHFQSVAAAINIDQFGSLCRITVSEDEPFGGLLYYWLRDRGVHIWEGFGCFLTTSHSDAEVRLIIDAFKSSVADLQAGGLLTVSGKSTDPSPSGRDARAQGSNGSIHGGSVDAELAAVEEGQIPLSDGQREIWHASQMGDEESCAYNESFTLDLRGPLQVSVLQEAVRQAVSRHDALRFLFSDEGPSQRVGEFPELELEVEDLSELEPAAREAAIQELHDEDARTPFDLENGPIIRFRLLRAESDRFLLVGTSHHIVMDGWSAGVIIEDISALYNAAVCNASPDLIPASSYADYVVGERRRRSQADGQEVLEYWVEKFKTLPEPADLPTDRPRPRVKTHGGTSFYYEFNKDVYRDFKQAATKENVTFFAGLLAAYQVLVHKLTGKQDLVVGIPSAGQAMVGEQSLVGHCVNLLPVRSLLNPKKSFRELLAQTREAVFDTYENQDCAFGTILQKVRVKRDPSRLPLFEVIFNLDRDVPGRGFEGLSAAIRENTKGASHFDMFLNLNEGDASLEVKLDYNTDLYDESTIRRWVDHFEKILAHTASNPAVAIGEIDLLGAEQKRQIEVKWNATESDYDHELRVQDLFAAQVQSAPHQPAMTSIAGDSVATMSYQQLDEAANRLAGVLAGHRQDRETCVAIFTERDPEMVVAMLATWKAGLHYLPIDPGLPAERVAMMLADSGAVAVLTQGKLAAAARELGLPCVFVDELPETAAAAAELPQVKSSDLAYLIYTSGSTGRPKGVEVSHRSVVNFLLSMAQKPGLGANDSLLAVTTLSFDISVLELMLPLIVGGRMVLAEQDDAADGPRLKNLLADHEITCMQATPMTWRILLECDWEGKQDFKALVGGEAFPRDLVAPLVERCGEVWNMYGPTETTIWSSCDLVSDDGSLTIGRPIANTGLYILGPDNASVPIGAIGELHIGGDGLARGYRGKPELTAERFIHNPLAAGAGNRLYKTGDLARFLADGRVECLGRLDHQVKLHGFRIELGEIEAVLGEADGVARSAVALRADGQGGSRLAAYVVAEKGLDKELDSAQLRAYLEKRLPEFMVPQSFNFLAALPETPNGKLDREALPAPDRDAYHSDEGYLAPTTSTEEKLCELWRTVLQIERIGIRDNFFDLGGHSLLALRMLARVRSDFEVSLGLRGFFENSTIRGLAEYVEAAQYTAQQPERSDNEDSVTIEL